VPGNHTGDSLAAVVAVADPDADAVADPQPLAPLCVVDVNVDRPDGNEFARLPRPRKVGFHVAAETTREDSLERGALLAGRPRVDVQHPRPGRARLVVAVAAGERDGEAGEVGAVRIALLDQPREDTHADAVR
jgi:hypothetical protein